MVFKKNNTPGGFSCDLQSNLDSWDEFRSDLGKLNYFAVRTC